MKPNKHVYGYKSLEEDGGILEDLEGSLEMNSSVKWRGEAENKKRRREIERETKMLVVTKLIKLNWKLKPDCYHLLKRLTGELICKSLMNLNKKGQKSRIRWTIDGDENSSFFHGIIKGNKKKNLESTEFLYKFLLVPPSPHVFSNHKMMNIDICLKLLFLTELLKKAFGIVVAKKHLCNIPLFPVCKVKPSQSKSNLGQQKSSLLF
uniref:Uncharacterized protein n=1 Tax=Lactuca sativa TaxID=4236 RepID=A0A9R1V2S4_LACSA|nr:hypothetical protein LSAT_V11C700367940 [Lactuca sativa]